MEAQLLSELSSVFVTVSVTLLSGDYLFSSSACARFDVFFVLAPEIPGECSLELTGRVMYSFYIHQIVRMVSDGVFERNCLPESQNGGKLQRIEVRRLFCWLLRGWKYCYGILQCWPRHISARFVFAFHTLISCIRRWACPSFLSFSGVLQVALLWQRLFIC